MEITPSSAEVTFIPQNTKRPNGNPNTFHSALLIQIPLQVCQSNVSFGWQPNVQEQKRLVLLKLLALISHRQISPECL